MSASGSRVFVTQRPTHRDESGARVVKHDLSPAASFGVLHDLVPPTGNIRPQDIPAVTEHIKAALSTFDPARDYVVFAGDPVVAAITAAVLGGFGRFTMLKWNSRGCEYVALEVTL